MRLHQSLCDESHGYTIVNGYRAIQNTISNTLQHTLNSSGTDEFFYGSNTSSTFSTGGLSTNDGGITYTTTSSVDKTYIPIASEKDNPTNTLMIMKFEREKYLDVITYAKKLYQNFLNVYSSENIGSKVVIALHYISHAIAILLQEGQDEIKRSAVLEESFSRGENIISSSTIRATNTEVCVDKALIAYTTLLELGFPVTYQSSNLDKHANFVVKDIDTHYSLTVDINSPIPYQDYYAANIKNAPDGYIEQGAYYAFSLLEAGNKIHTLT